MQLVIKSRKLKKEVTFSRPGGYYIFVDLNGKSGTLGVQICEHGSTMGSTIGYGGESEVEFNAICRCWFDSYLKNFYPHA